MHTALLLLPDFSLILLGFALRRWMHLGEHFWAGLEMLVYFILFPALLVNAISKTPLDFAVAGPFLLTALTAMAGGMLLGYLLRFVFTLRPLAFASIYQCGFRFNSYIGLAVAGLLYGEAGIAAMGLILGVAVPFANFTAVWMLARHGESSVWREVVRNPLIWATVAGLLLNLAGFTPPKPLQIFLGRLADASIALGLLAVGATLKLQGTSGLKCTCCWSSYSRCRPSPLRWGDNSVCTGFIMKCEVAVLFAALPTASSAYILAMRMGGDGQSVAWLVSASTLGSMLTLPFWAAWLAG
jgi:hypothetical protein